LPINVSDISVANHVNCASVTERDIQNCTALAEILLFIYILHIFVSPVHIYYWI